MEWTEENWDNLERCIPGENLDVLKMRFVEPKLNIPHTLDLELHDKDGKIKENFTVKIYVKNAAKKVIIFYQVILNFLCNYVSKLQYRNEHLSSCFPKLINTVQNLNENSCFLFTENVRSKHFLNVDWQKGLNMSKMETIMENLANFHSVIMIMKIKSLETYKKFLKEGEITFCNNIHGRRFFISDLLLKTCKNFSVNGILDSDIKLLTDTLRNKYDRIETNSEKSENVIHTYHTLILQNCFFNNIFINSERGDVKFIDPTSYKIGSFAYDFLNFYFCSSSLELLKDQTTYGHLFKHYYKALKWHLNNLDENHLEETFSETQLLKELERVGKDNYFIIILKIINDLINSNENVIETSLDKMDQDDLKKECKKKLLLIFETLKTFGWI